jgi:hypothetical protein
MKKLHLLSIILFSIIFNTSCENEPVNVRIDSSIYKPINNEIIEGLQKVAKYGNINNERVCVEFIYPFTILTFDSNYESVAAHEIEGSNQLVFFLENLSEDLNISLSYPLAATLPNGLIISITSNEELVLALNACTNEDIIAVCNAQLATAVQCVIKIPYTSSGYDNRYAGGYFTGNGDGSINFNYQNSSYLGTWTHLFLNSELHLNIYLLGSTSVSQYWNKNYKLTGSYDTAILNYGYNIILNRSCGVQTNYSVGQTGPNNGIIAHEKEAYTHGWKYFEIAGEDLPQEEWGCKNASIILAENDEIGTGLMNSIAIANYHEEINYFINPGLCSTENNGTVTSKTALLSQAPSYNNWFIPSIEELQLMYTNLHLNGQGNFVNTIYWSSTQASISKAFGLDFSNGTVVEIPKSSSTAKTRKIIYF